MMAQTWEELLFAHWRVPADALGALIPNGLELDLFDGEAWLGVTPFRVTNLRMRGLPPFPAVSSFLEVNTRTYVTAEDKPGVWFFSLDASSRLAVEAARLGYKLPYFWADMRAEWGQGWLSYAATRRDERGGAFRGRYRPTGDSVAAEPGSLAHFLTERYCLYASDSRGRVHRAEIHHPPWPLQPAEAEIDENTLPPAGVPLGNEDPLLHFSARQDVVVWLLEPV
jgi:uncharacterized protein YqjF (DUF2071 family)